ncbi:hypothetical protein PputUW4_04906 [Pseudomonas sp. UW4]|nr:hypothetical protein PputUW4_04906 [Pseudomonas sp. UW4]
MRTLTSPVSGIRSSFGEWILLPDKAPRRVIARYGEERQRSMAAKDTVKIEQLCPRRDSFSTIQTTVNLE